MRRTGFHAIQADFRPVSSRTRDVLERGEPISSMVVFPEDCPGDPQPASLLLEACSPDAFDGQVRAELLVRPHDTCRLPRGIEFKLVAGREILGHGRIREGFSVFRTLRRVTSRQEAFHSHYLCDALRQSLEGDRSLFDHVWRRVAPSGWAVPEVVEVMTEGQLRHQRRIDILIRDPASERVVGLELKTVDASARTGQLEQYWQDLCCCYGGPASVGLAFLTPFNEVMLASEPHMPKTVEVFREFQGWVRAEHGPELACTHVRHVSWLDLASIPWAGNAVWEQHREYVYQHMCGPGARAVSTLVGGRTFEHFFGKRAADAFWHALEGVGVEGNRNGVALQVSRFNGRNLADAITEAVGALTEMSEAVSRDADNDDRFAGKDMFLNSQNAHLHAAIFKLASRSGCLWLQGKKNYGLRVAHENHPKGVSLVTSRGFDHLDIGRPR